MWGLADYVKINSLSEMVIMKGKLLKRDLDTGKACIYISLTELGFIFPSF